MLITPTAALTKTAYREAVMAEANPTKRARFRESNPNWRGGRTVTEHGYVLIRVGVGHPLADVRGYAYEHRLKAWEAGQEVEGKRVHHEDEIKTNNDLKNLSPLTPAWHGVAHRTTGINKQLPGEPNPLIECACGCGATFEKYDPHKRPRRFISGHNMYSRGR